MSDRKFAILGTLAVVFAVASVTMYASGMDGFPWALAAFALAGRAVFSA